jgi:hypothetical protein
MKALSLSIGVTQGAEQELEAALERLAERHSRDFEIEQGCKLFDQWAKSHLSQLLAAATRHGVAPSSDPSRVARALFHGLRTGGFGLLRDLQDLLILVQQARNCWTVLGQAAKEMRDQELGQTAEKAGGELDRMIDWTCTHIKLAAPQALTVPPQIADEMKGSIPKRLTTAAFPRLSLPPLLTACLSLAAGVVLSEVVMNQRRRARKPR